MATAMMNTYIVGFIFTYFLLTFFAITPTTAKNKPAPNPTTGAATIAGNNPVIGLCSAASQFIASYNQNCRNSSTTNQPDGNLPSPVVAYCRAVANRLANADDISGQNTRMLEPGAEESDICYEKDERLQVIINTLNKAVTYFETLKNLKYNSAVIGIRTVQAQIVLTLQTTANSKMKISSTLLEQLMSLERRCKDVAVLLEDQNSWSWNMADQMTSGSFFWKSPSSWKSWDILSSARIEPVPYFRNLTHYKRDHEINNECHIRMMRDCDLSEECANIFMDKFGEITTLAHNTDFFRMATRLDCVKEIEFTAKFPDRNWEQFTQRNCERMWNEANTISSAGFPNGYKGVFLIHGAMCAMMGYPNFLRVDWVNSVIEWKNSTANGCIAPDTKSGTGEIELGYDDLAADGVWCTIYETSLGMQLLALHMRYALEICPATNNHVQSD